MYRYWLPSFTAVKESYEAVSHKIMPMIEDEPVKPGFPLEYALSWGFPPSSPPDLYFYDFSYFLCYGNIFIISIFFEIFRVLDIFHVFQCFFLFLIFFDYFLIFALC